MSNDNKKRDLLGFQETVKKYFNFAEIQYGYKCVFSDPYCVKYYSSKAYLNIYHERISYEIYFEIGILPEYYGNALKVTIDDVVNNSNCAKEQIYYQASNKSGINEIVEKLANIIKQYTREALNGYRSYFELSLKKRLERQQKWTFMEELKRAEEKAQNAWACKDYGDVIKAYQHFEEHLNPIQLKRLKYSRRMLHKKSGNGF